MALILSLETAVSFCSVALHQDGILLSYGEIQIQRSHSEMITILIDQIVRFAKKELHSIEAVAVSRGPGSFTGLRVGSSTAKGLCFGLDIPLLAVDTLKALAYEVKIPGFWVCPMIDARRLEVYCALYNDANEIQSPSHPKVLDEDSFKDILSHRNVIFCGNGADKARDIIKHENAMFLPDKYPTAKSIGYLAGACYKDQQFVDVANYEPFYLKDFHFNKPKHKNPLE